MVYTEMMQTQKVYVRQCSSVPVYALLLFGGDLAVDHINSKIVIDEWAKVTASPKVGVLIRELRKRLDALLALKFEDASICIHEHPIASATVELVRTDGM
jgi:ATP-dependent RNA helicase DHX57